MRKKGKIKTWNIEKAYGFITPLANGRDIFIHQKDFANRERAPKVGDLVTYTVAQDQQGRACAVDALYSGEKRVEKPKQTRGDLTIVGIIAFGLIAAASAMLGKTPFWLPGIYLGMSCLTFLIYWSDKSAAKKDQWRTPESTLHTLALAGGWPGAALAQQKLRHKSKKQEFRFIYWLTVLLNIGFFVWLHTEHGAAFQSSILGL